MFAAGGGIVGAAVFVSGVFVSVTSAFFTVSDVVIPVSRRTKNQNANPIAPIVSRAIIMIRIIFPAPPLFFGPKGGFSLPIEIFSGASMPEKISSGSPFFIFIGFGIEAAGGEIEAGIV